MNGVFKSSIFNNFKSQISNLQVRFLIALAFLPSCLLSQSGIDSAFVRENYTKREVYITMRDGTKLFTSIYEPKDGSQSYPILMQRTPYSCSPYGASNYRRSLGPNRQLLREKYIFVYQDVRGRYKSEGHFKEMTPAIDQKKSNADVDESSDTYDTIEWLLKNTRNNGRVGIYGISYPGFYATASLPAAHPALKAVSPQAPVTDEFVGDDCNHNGAFFLLDNFDFYNYFDGARSKDSTRYENVFSQTSADAYHFFQDIEPLKKSNDKRYYDNKGEIWSEVVQHDTYDTFWVARNIRPHLVNIKPAVLVVGGWFDAEDLFGALRTYEAIEKQNPSNNNRIIMGPWTHGAWSATTWERFGPLDFGKNLNDFYKEKETAFFNFYLKDKGQFNEAEATVFETGSNQWRQFSSWPPSNATNIRYYLHANSGLSTDSSRTNSEYSQYTSDPRNPVPYTGIVSRDRNNEYMVEDQRFLSGRSDILAFQSAPLPQNVDVIGRLHGDVFVSTTGTDLDLIVKLIDVFPDTASPGRMANMQRLVRAEVFRGKFRKSYEKPEPFEPGRVEKISFDLNEIAHQFGKGHRIMVMVQSSWFPIVDLNPQKFVKIPEANPSDFQKADIRVYHDSAHPSSITLPVIQ